MTNERNMHISTTSDDARVTEADAESLNGRTLECSEGHAEDGGRTLEDIISDVAEQEFAQYPPVSMTPEKLKAMADKRRTSRRTARKKRINKLAAGIAAVFVLMLIGVVTAFKLFPADVGADKNQPEEIKTEDGVVIEDGGYGASEDENDIWVTTDWNDIEHAKLLFPKLVIPEYIPEGYEFDQLTVEQIEADTLISEYIFANTEREVLEIELFVQASGEISLDVNDVSRPIESSKGTIYIQEYDNKIATIQIDGGKNIYIISNLSDEEIVEIINGLIV